jgi:hypothetical protein
MSRFRRAVALVLFGLVLATAAGCGAESRFKDGCSVELEFDQVSYSDVGFSTRATTQVGTGQIRACAADSESRGVKVLEFDSYPRTEVIGVRDEDDKVRVFFANTLTEERRQQILGDRLLNAGSQ